ncbi:MAG: YbhB/YbcL family Raf kinase inhibitor-like protein [Patescibacteria group bacterium]
MELKSPEFNNKGPIPVKFTCDEEDISPTLTISGVPDGAKSLALIMEDPDAPGGTWVHWVAWNIEPDTSEIGEGELPVSAGEGITSAKTRGYHGPCPPLGRHRYFFRLFALDAMLKISGDTDAEGLRGAMGGHVLSQAEYMGTYERR